MRAAAAILATIALAGPAAAREPSAADIVVGPINMGMSMAQARGLVANGKIVPNGRLEAPNAFLLAGRPVDLLFDTDDHEGDIRVELTTRWYAEPGECKRWFAKVLTELEPSLGAFEPADPGGYTVEAVGKASRLGWFRTSADWDRSGDRLPHASAYVHSKTTGGPLDVLSQANEEHDFAVDADGRLQCEFFMNIIYDPRG